MDDKDHGDDVRLSLHERFVLKEMETRLRRDWRFGRAMRGGPSRVWLPLTVALMGAASVVLAIVGMRTTEPAVLWCFAGLWPFTVLQAFRLLCRVSRTGDRPTRWT